MILEPPFDVGPDSTFGRGSSRASTYTRKPPFTLTYHIRPEARWSDGCRSRPGTSSSPTSDPKPALAGVDDTTRRSPQRPRDRREDRPGRPALPLRGLARSLRERPAARMRSRARTSTTIWRDRIDNPKTGRPIGSGPFLVERWERGKQLASSATRATGGRIPPTSTGSSFASGRQRATRSTGFGAASSTSPPASSPSSPGTPSAEPGVSCSLGPGPIWSTSRSGSVRPAIPPSKSKLIRRALAYGIDRAALVRQAPARSTRSYAAATASSFSTQSPYYRPNWSSYRYRPRSPAAARAGRLPPRRRRHLLLRRRAALASLRTAPASRAVGADRRARAGAAPAGRRRGRAGLRPPPAVFEQILPGGDFDVALFAGFSSPPDPTGNAVFGCGGSQNYTGYCQRLVTRDLDQADRILDAARGRAS